MIVEETSHKEHARWWIGARPGETKKERHEKRVCLCVCAVNLSANGRQLSASLLRILTCCLLTHSWPTYCLSFLYISVSSLSIFLSCISLFSHVCPVHCGLRFAYYHLRHDNVTGVYTCLIGLLVSWNLSKRSNSLEASPLKSIFRALHLCWESGSLCNDKGQPDLSRNLPNLNPFEPNSSLFWPWMSAKILIAREALEVSK